ncbi:hypothetical protein C4544_02490 [candidate division WS5 bacterium]|uniref:Uncharacterized protein n=1 Tax=candidate division WS5 bacterium TaxID=2093353 RepID=A0A419DES2_9BACT|nr:MAG: hypothetical protein C4544_02490 [candidate division WS5 bacterium]
MVIIRKVIKKLIPKEGNMADKIISPNEKVGILDFLIKHSKKSIIALVAVSLVASVALVAAWWYTGGSEVIAMYGDKKVLKTVYEDEKSKCESFYEYNTDKEGKKSCSEKEIEDQILKKALETEAENRGINVTEDEINERYKDIVSVYASEDSYKRTLKNTYGWTPEYVKENIKRDLLQEKLEQYLIGSKDVYGVFVRWDWYIGESDRAKNKENEGPSREMMDKNLYPLMKSGATNEQIIKKIKEIRATNPEPWNKEYNIVAVPFTKVKKDTFQGKEDLEAISKLKKVGDITGVVRSSGGYFVVYRLDRISNGNFADWEEFTKDAVGKAKIKSLSYKFKKFKHAISTKYHTYMKKAENIFNPKTVQAGHCQDYSFSKIWGRLFDGSDHSLPINNASIVATNNCPCEPGSAGCTQTRASCVMCDQESFSHSTTSGNDAAGNGGFFSLGKPADGDIAPVPDTYYLSCYHGWFLDISKAGYENIRYNKSTAPNATSIHADRGDTQGWEWYSGPGGIYASWNTDNNSYVFMKPIETLGNFEGASCTSISGWALDMTDEEYQTKIHIYEGTSSAVDWTRPVTNDSSLDANLSRPDVAAAFDITNENHGFSLVTPASLKDGKDHWIWTYAFTKGGSPYSLGAPKMINCPVEPPVSANSCPTSCTASPGTVTQGNPVTITWSGGVGTVTSLIQNPGSTIPNPTSGMQVIPSTNTSYSLTVEGVAGTCPCNPVPVIVKPHQSGSDSPVPPN